MGSWTSGKARGAPKETAFWRLDLARLKELNCLKPGRFSISWSSHGEERASISCEIPKAFDRMILDYRSKERGGEWQHIRDTAWFATTTPNLGGERIWFCCPGCGERCRVLFGAKYYRCRKCQRMTYSSQYDPMPQLPWSRCHRVRERLGGERGFSYPFPPKPKGMHWKTYYKLLDEDCSAENLLCVAMNDRLLGIRKKYRL